MTKLLCLSTLALLATANLSSGQTFQDGYGARSDSLPTDTSHALAVDDAVVWFTGQTLVLREKGQTRTLLTLPKKVFGSFTIRVAPDALLFGESTDHGIWLVPTSATGAPRKLNTIQFNYAATAYDDDWAIVSAKTGGFTSRVNDLIAVNLKNGSLDTIAIVDGASGPVVGDGFGNLYYATASNSFPAPKNAVEILRFAANQIAGAFGASWLGTVDGAVVMKGIDTGSAMTLDDDNDLFVVDWRGEQIVEVSDVHTARPTFSTLASYSSASVSPSSLQFVRGDRRGFASQEFEPFQPEGGGSLVIHETKFGSTSQLRTLDAARATTGLDTADPVPKSTFFRVVIANGPTNGAGFVGLGPDWSSREVVSRFGFEQPVFWSASLMTPFLLSPVSFDSNGRARLPLFNPGFAAPLRLTAQGLFTDNGSTVAGSSRPLAFTVR